MSFSAVPPTLLGLVERYSPSGNESAAVSWLVERMHTLGAAQSFSDAAGSAVGVWGEGPRQIVLLGHIDTVPGEIPLRLEGNILYGRGSVDAKGPLAAFVDAAAALGAVPGWQVAVIGAVGEETDSRGARFLVEHYRPDFAVIGEPSGAERITLGYKGSAAARLTFTTPLSHSARMEERACEAAFRTWGSLSAQVEQFNSGREAVFDRLQIGLNGFSSSSDGLREEAVLEIGARLPLDLAPDAYYALLQAGAEAAEMQPQGFAIPAFRAEKSSPLVRAFLGAVRAQGGQPRFALKTGTADLNIVAPAWNCPAVAYGPGDSALDHTPDEHLALDEYQQAVKTLAGLLEKLTHEV